MKKLLLSLATVALFSSGAMGQKLLYDVQFGKSVNVDNKYYPNNSSYTGSFTYTLTGTETFTIEGFNNNNNGWDLIKCGRKGNTSVANIITDFAVPSPISEVALSIEGMTVGSVNSIKLYTSTDKETWTESTSVDLSAATIPGVLTFTPKGTVANLYYKVAFDCASGSANGFVQLSGVKYYSADSASDLEPAGLAFETPSVDYVPGVDEFKAPELANPNNLKVTYSSDNEKVTVAADGTLTFASDLTSGKVTITATSEATDKFAAGKASYVINIIPSVTSLSELKEMTPNKGDKAYVNFPLIVAYVNGNYCYVQHYLGDAALIFQATGYEEGTMIPKGWIATYSPYNGLPEYTMNVVPEAPDKTFAEILNVESVSLEDVNKIVVLQGVTFSEATPDTKKTFKGKLSDDSELTFYNQFTIASSAAGTYDVKCAVAVYNSNLQVYPIEIKEPFVGPNEAPDEISVVVENGTAVWGYDEEQGLDGLNVKIATTEPSSSIKLVTPEGFDGWFVVDYSKMFGRKALTRGEEITEWYPVEMVQEWMPGEVTDQIVVNTPEEAGETAVSFYEAYPVCQNMVAMNHYMIFVSVTNGVASTDYVVTPTDTDFLVTPENPGFTFNAARNDGNNNPVYNENGKDFRIYAKGSLTISVPKGLEVTEVTFNLSAQGLKRLAPISANVGEIATQTKGDETVVWTGNVVGPRDIVFTVGETAEYGSEDTKAGQLCFSTFNIKAGEPSGDVLQPAELSFDVESCDYIPGKPFKAPVLNNPNELPVTYTSDNEKVTVAEDGTVTVAPEFTSGSAVITAASEATDTFEAGSASYTLNVIPKATSLVQLKELTTHDGDKAYVDFNLIVAYVNGASCYVQDLFGESTLIYQTTEYKEGDYIPGGWIASYKLYNSLPEYTMSEMPAPISQIDPEFEQLSEISVEDVNKIIILKGVTLAQATPATKTSFTGTLSNGEALTLYNNFLIESVEAGKYDVKCAVALFRENLQVYPIEYNEPFEGPSSLPDEISATVEDGTAVWGYNEDYGSKGLNVEIVTDKEQATITLDVPEELSGWYIVNPLINIDSMRATRADVGTWYPIEMFQQYQHGEISDKITIDTPEEAGETGEAFRVVFPVYQNYVGEYSYMVYIKVTKSDDSAVGAIETTDEDATYYNLQGVKVTNPSKGIYVKTVNGKSMKVNIK